MNSFSREKEKLLFLKKYCCNNVCMPCSSENYFHLDLFPVSRLTGYSDEDSNLTILMQQQAFTATISLVVSQITVDSPWILFAGDLLSTDQTDNTVRDTHQYNPQLAYQYLSS